MLFDTVTYEQWKDRAYALAHTFRENLYWVAPYPTSYTSERKQMADIFGNILNEYYIKNGSCPDRVILTNSISGPILPKMNIWHHTFIIKYKNEKDTELYKKICEDLGYSVTVFKKVPSEKKIAWTKFLTKDHRAWVTEEDYKELPDHEKKVCKLNTSKIFTVPCKVKESELREHGLISIKEFLIEEALHHIIRKGCIENIYLYKNVASYRANVGMHRLLNSLPLHNNTFRKDRKLNEKSKYFWERIIYDSLYKSNIKNIHEVIEELQKIPPSKHIKKITRRSPVYDPNNVIYQGSIYDVGSVIDLYLFKERDKYAKIYFDLMKGRTYD